MATLTRRELEQQLKAELGKLTPEAQLDKLGVTHYTHGKPPSVHGMALQLTPAFKKARVQAMRYYTSHEVVALYLRVASTDAVEALLESVAPPQKMLDDADFFALTTKLPDSELFKLLGISFTRHGLGVAVQGVQIKQGKLRKLYGSRIKVTHWYSAQEAVQLYYSICGFERKYSFQREVTKLLASYEAMAH